MLVPFFNKFSQKQYLDLETVAINLFTAVQSLMTITEGENLDSDSQKIIHFNALCERINQIIGEYTPKIQKVRNVMYNEDSATTPSTTEPSGTIQILVNKQEYSLVIEALEHMANSLSELKVSDQFQELADDIKDLK